MKKIIALVTLITIITTATAQKKEGIGLVLSGGGALGYAHIGAL